MLDLILDPAQAFGFICPRTDMNNAGKNYCK